MSSILLLGVGPFTSAAGYANAQALNFVSASSQRLSMSDANFGAYDRAKFSISAWFKNGSLSAQRTIMSQWGAAGNIGWNLRLGASDNLIFTSSVDGTATDGNMVTTAAYSDTTTWHHVLLWYDSANATSNDRCRIWVDGTEVTSFSTGTRPSAAVFDSTNIVAIGMRNSALYWNGLLDEIAFFSGTLATITDLITGTPGTIKNLTGLTGLKSWVRSDNGITVDEVLGTAWTNTNSVTQSTDVP